MALLCACAGALAPEDVVEPLEPAAGGLVCALLDVLVLLCPVVMV